MTLDELQRHPLYEQLTKSERVFICVYLTSRGSIVQSVTAAFPLCRRVLTKGRQLADNRAVGVLMSILDGINRPTQENLEQIAMDAIRRASKPYEVYRGLKEIRELRKLEKPQQDDRSEKLRRGKQIDEEFRRKNNV